jgi:alpha-beta hydrolase superfamily lysophospholipase
VDAGLRFESLAQAGAASVFTPDLRGHGERPQRRGDVDYVDQLEDDLADLVSHVRERCPRARCIVGGHSSDGGLAVRFAGSRHRDLADGLLLLAPFLGHDAPTTRPGSGGWARPRIPRIVALSALDGLGIRSFQGTTVITFAMPEEVRDGTETLAYSDRLNAGLAPRSYRRDLADLRVPLLALVGADDEAFYTERFEPALAPFSQAEVAVIGGAGHLDLPGHPDATRSIVRWLARFA